MAIERPEEACQAICAILVRYEDTWRRHTPGRTRETLRNFQWQLSAALGRTSSAQAAEIARIFSSTKRGELIEAIALPAVGHGSADDVYADRNIVRSYAIDMLDLLMRHTRSSRGVIAPNILEELMAAREFFVTADVGNWPFHVSS